MEGERQTWEDHWQTILDYVMPRKADVTFVRSKGEKNPVNVFAGDNFEGGGHERAAGGISDLDMDNTLQKIRSLIPQYFRGEF